VSSELLGVEYLRTLDRVRLCDHLDGRAFGERRRAMLDVIAAIEIVPLVDWLRRPGRRRGRLSSPAVDKPAA